MPTTAKRKVIEIEYEPRGACGRAFVHTGPELLISGPAGTGKSRACLEKIWLAAEHHPGMRALIVRQVRASLSTTGLVTWEKIVLPPNARWIGDCSREHRTEYKFPNGSVVNCGGLDKPGKIMSSEYDLIYVQEATEVKEEGWQALSTRLRNGVMPYQQLLADCNPSAPTHWLKRRCESGKTKYYESRHEDNPRLWNKAAKDWTDEGRKYIERLDNLTGSLKLRLRYGRWAQAEGVVYELWDSERHLVDRFTIPSDWTRYLSIDFGYTNPFVCQWWARDPDGRFFLYREVYRTKRLVEDHATHVKRLHGNEPEPVAVYTDHDAEDRATFAKYTGWLTSGAVKSVAQGIQLVTARLQNAGDGRPRLFVMRDSVVDRDPELLEAKKPTCLEEEMDAYVWAPGVDGKPNKEEPVKEHDHACDAMRYLVASHDGRPKSRAWICGEEI